MQAVTKCWGLVIVACLVLGFSVEGQSSKKKASRSASARVLTSIGKIRNNGKKRIIRKRKSVFNRGKRIINMGGFVPTAIAPNPSFASPPLVGGTLNPNPTANSGNQSGVLEQVDGTNSAPSSLFGSLGQSPGFGGLDENSGAGAANGGGASAGGSDSGGNGLPDGLGPTAETGPASVDNSPEREKSGGLFQDDSLRDRGPLAKREQPPDPIHKDRSPPQRVGEDNGQGIPPAGQIMPKWKPICFIFDPKNINRAGAIVKKVVDAHAACGVYVLSHVFEVEPNYDPDPDVMAQLSRQVCPLNSHYGVAETSIVFNSGYDDTSDKMCGTYNPKDTEHNTAGCAEWIPPRSMTQKEIEDFKKNRKSNGGSHGFGGEGSRGTPAFATVDIGKNSDVFNHEIGHHTGLVNVGAGDGTKPGGFATQWPGKLRGGGGGGSEFTKNVGCRALQDAANDNVDQYAYDAASPPEGYYLPWNNGEGRWSLTAGKSWLDSDVKLPPAPTPHPTAKKINPPPGGGGGAGDRGGKSVALGKPPRSPGKGKSIPPAAPAPASKHKKRKAPAGPPPAPQTGTTVVENSNPVTEQESDAFSSDFFGEGIPFSSEGDSVASGGGKGSRVFLDENLEARNRDSFFEDRGNGSSAANGSNRLIDSLGSDSGDDGLDSTSLVGGTNSSGSSGPAGTDLIGANLGGSSGEELSSGEVAGAGSLASGSFGPGRRSSSEEDPEGFADEDTTIFDQNFFFGIGRGYSAGPGGLRRRDVRTYTGDDF